MMSVNSKQRRNSIRLMNFDYSSNGAYFVTVCTVNKELILGSIKSGIVKLSEYGKITESEWLKTGEKRSNIILDEYVIMPNHFHGILLIVKEMLV